MSFTKETSKVSPTDKPRTKQDNFVTKSINTLSKLRLVIYIEALLGINRVYLYQDNKLILWFCHFNSFVLVITALYYIIVTHSYEGSTLVYKETCCVEYLLLVLSCTFMQGKRLETFFRDLTTFDEMLNIKKDLTVIISLKRPVVWIFISVVHVTLEFVIFSVYVYDTFDCAELVVYLTIVAHDSEQVYFCTLLRTILRRLRILKAHVAKAFFVYEKEIDKEEVYELDYLAKNIDLNTTTMHRAFELLHKCADELNSLMSFPMIVMLFASGLSTTMLLKNIFKLLQTTEGDPMLIKAIIIYATVRCVKYTLLVIVPCLYSSITTKQVSVIRTMLHDAINTFDLDKVERRKVKAFFQLTQDNEFAYALWGVIRLNMTLPLSYSSLCTTYLVIIIQFSKFID